MKELEIAYIGGGSRGWARGLMSDLAKEGRISGKMRLYDIDYEAAKDNEIIGNSIYDREDVVGKWKYKAVKTIGEALTGADFVIISILPGTFEEMTSDVHTPEKYGIWQPVGDTVGPGGVIRALRTIPMFVEIAKAVEAYAPDAWVINYTNPMTICVRTLYETFPGIKAFGCCHEVFGTQKLLAQIYQEATGESATRDEIEINVLGINHFTWLDKATCKGTDLFPLYRNFIETHLSGSKEDNSGHWANKDFVSHELVKFDLFRRYGLIAAAGDRHLAEFCPGRWYLENPETVAKWTRVYVDLPDGEMQVFLNIITFAEAVLQTKFDPSFFIALADHLHYAIERSREEISLQNPLAWEVRNFTLGSMKLENKSFV